MHNASTLRTPRRRRSPNGLFSVKYSTYECPVCRAQLGPGTWAVREGRNVRCPECSTGPTRNTTPAGGRPHGAVEAAPRAAQGAGPLTERYRPRTLDAIRGQPDAVRVLRRFAASPYPTALMFEGETGTGKTTAALSLAEALGCDLTQKPSEFGGVCQIASGEQTADAVRDTYRMMWNCPMFGSGWKVVIVNEADRMNVAAETVWLDRLENIPARTVIVFTTNHLQKLSARFRDRSTRLTFESDAGRLRESVHDLLAAIWKAETGRAPSKKWIAGIVEGAIEDGKVSFRRAVQLLTPLVLIAGEKGGA